MELTFGFQGLFAAGELFHVVEGEGEEMRYAGADFVDEGLLSFAEGRFGEEFEVLYSC